AASDAKPERPLRRGHFKNEGKKGAALPLLCNELNHLFILISPIAKGIAVRKFRYLCRIIAQKLYGCLHMGCSHVWFERGQVAGDRYVVTGLRAHRIPLPCLDALKGRLHFPPWNGTI